MKNLFALLLLAVLLSCTPFAPNPPTRVDITAAKGLFLRDGAAPPAGLYLNGPAASGELYQLLPDNTTAAVTYTDAEGKTVDVTLTRTLQLDADHLLIDYTATSTSGVGVVTISTGALNTLTAAPDNWERIRTTPGVAYYVSGGALYRLDLPAAETDISQGDRISPASLLFLDGQGNVHTFYLVNGSIDPANQIRIYYANGDPVDVLGWGSPDAYLLCQGYGSTYFEDETSGAVYAVKDATAQGFTAQPVTMDASGVNHGTVDVLDAAFHPAAISSTATGRVYLGNTLYMRADTGEVAALTLSAGAITGAVKRTLSFPLTDRPMRYIDGQLYAASSSGISRLDIATGTEELLTTVADVTDIEVVADQVFYSTAAGIYQYDTVDDGTTLYTGGEVVPVLE